MNEWLLFLIMLAIVIAFFWWAWRSEKRNPHKWSPFYCPHCAVFLPSTAQGMFAGAWWRTDYKNLQCPSCGRRM